VAKGKKRELKAKAKVLSGEIISKGRSNRDEDMNHFVTYYRERFKGVTFKVFKSTHHADETI
jgi:hypothetical protein